MLYVFCETLVFSPVHPFLSAFAAWIFSVFTFHVLNVVSPHLQAACHLRAFLVRLGSKSAFMFSGFFFFGAH